MQAYRQADVPTYRHTGMHNADRHTYLHTYLLTYIPTYVHTYINIYRRAPTYLPTCLPTHFWLQSTLTSAPELDVEVHTKILGVSIGRPPFAISEPCHGKSGLLQP